MAGIMRLQQRGFAWQVEVPQARDPETQGAGAQHGRQQGTFLGTQAPHRLVGREEGIGPCRVVRAAVQVDAPVVQADADVEQKGVAAGEVEIKEAGEFGRAALAVEHHVVAEQIGMDGAARQGAPAGGCRHMVLVGQLGQDQAVLRFVQVRQHHRHGVVPPGQPAQVGLAAREVASGQVHARQRLPDGSAMRGCGRQLAAAAQPVHHGGGLVLQAQQDFASWSGVAGHGGLRLRHRDAVLRQVFHQVQVKRQLLEAQALEQGQHIAALLGVHKIIGVFDAAGAGSDALQLPQSERMQKRSGLVKRDFGIDGHA